MLFEQLFCIDHTEVTGAIVNFIVVTLVCFYVSIPIFSTNFSINVPFRQLFERRVLRNLKFQILWGHKGHSFKKEMPWVCCLKNKIFEFRQGNKCYGLFEPGSA
jgi:hypothetical protein